MGPGKPTADGKTPLLVALMEKRVKAETIDLDHFRIRGGMAVETDYIIRVESKEGIMSIKPTSMLQPSTSMQDFESFTLSKTYSAFRTLGHQLKKLADATTDSSDKLPKSVQKLAQYCDTVMQLAESQRTEYLGKVNYNYVKVMAKKRIHIVNDILEATLNYFPDKDDIETYYFHKEVAQTIETFFLLDHCVDEDNTRNARGLKRIRNPTYRFTNTTNNNQNIVEEDKKPVQPQTIPVLAEQLFEPLKAVGQVVGNVVGDAVGAVENVGTFIKEKLVNPIDIMPAIQEPLAVETTFRSPVVPYTRKSRRSWQSRDQDDKELEELGDEASLLLDDERAPIQLVPSYSHPVPTFGSPGSKLGDLLETNPLLFLAIFVAAAAFLKFAGKLTVTMDLDILLLLIWAGFCIGLHTPRPMVGGIDKSSTSPFPLSTPIAQRVFHKHDQYGRRLLRMSMARANKSDDTPTAASASVGDDSFPSPSGQRLSSNIEEIRQDDEDSLMEVGQSPLPKFPEGAPLGSKLNCWSEPDYETFQVRGSKYLSDKVKEASGPFIFPIRAVDLFLTDTCPENAGSNAGILGGMLREKPTFVINFRLPWGIFLAYFEIPERFLPFIRAAHEEGYDKSSLPSLDTMTPSDRCVARFCQSPQSEKNKTLKIVPVVVEGPWVVKSVVGGKPALIGNKLPVNYHYSPPKGKNALYLEADLDIVSSSAARGILSVTRTYTQALTIDLGFVVQGNSPDELPEQMLVGARLHGIDPLTAPPYPLSKDTLMQTITDGEDSGDEL